MDFGTIIPMCTGVVTVCSITGALNKGMFSDFSGNGRTVFSEFFRYLSERFSIVKTIFYLHSFFVCDIMGHGIRLLLELVDTLQHTKGILLCGETVSLLQYKIISRTKEIAENICRVKGKVNGLRRP